ncbi:MAG: hypothetical protein O3C60_10475 [Planctomycetota bacterium]|nr:hypothetical protein [Planctomycetota bacterium]
MITDYLLPCDCGSPQTVTTRQAGQQVTCRCGRVLTVPALRELRKLATHATEAKPRHKSWSLGRGISFFIGILLLLIGAGTYYYFQTLVSRFQVPTAGLAQQQLTERIEAANAQQLWELWTAMRENALASRPNPARAEAELLRDRLALVRNLGGGLAFLGVGLAAIAYGNIGRLLGSPGTSRT